MRVSGETENEIDRGKPRPSDGGGDNEDLTGLVTGLVTGLIDETGLMDILDVCHAPRFCGGRQ